MSISQHDFTRACTGLHKQWNRQSRRGIWQNVKLLDNHGAKWLRITCAVPLHRADGDSKSEEKIADAEIALDEEDEEALPPPTSRPDQPLVIYDIVHSPSYQVPVLYITFKDLPPITRGLPSPEEVYEMLVSSSYRPQIDSVGPLGALSTTDHPVTSTPAYFVHPCRTADAMEAMTGGEQLEPMECLMRWIGVIGQSFGLSVPVEFAQAMAPANGLGKDA